MNPPNRWPDSRDSAPYAKRYLDAALRGDRDGAAAAIESGLASGLGAPALLVDVIAAAQREIGERWHRQELSIAEEHRASEIARGEIERVRLARRPAQSLAATAVVCSAPGEPHSLPARLFAALLDCRGVHVELLGEAPPADDLVAFLQRRPPAVFALSVTLADRLGAARATCAAVARLQPRPRILVGGLATLGVAATDLGADETAADFAAGVHKALALAGLDAELDLPAYLGIVGRRIVARRALVGISQAELARRCGLARPYLGAVERGRQNITLDAALRIARALDWTVGELLGGV